LFITVGESNLDAAFQKLFVWAQKNQLTAQPNFRFYRIFHDSFKDTSPDKVRMSLGIPVPKPLEDTAEIKNRFFNSGKCMMGHFEISQEEFTFAWENMFQKFVEGGFIKSATEPFEIIYNDYRTHPEKKSIVDICIPIM
jgi:AraC family transcriptional regulator